MLNLLSKCNMFAPPIVAQFGSGWIFRSIYDRSHSDRMTCFALSVGHPLS